MKKALACAIVAIGLVLGSGGAAMAGETTGTGGDAQGAANASSACAFSGLDVADVDEGNPFPEANDDAVTVRGNQAPAGMERFHGVQSYGSIVRAGGKGMAPSPGEACRGNVEFGE